jgi:hypothetical protein
MEAYASLLCSQNLANNNFIRRLNVFHVPKLLGNITFPCSFTSQQGVTVYLKIAFVRR